MYNILIFLKYIFRLIFKKKKFNQKFFPLGYLDKKLKFKNYSNYFITNPYIITPKFYPFLNTFFTLDILNNLITFETIKLTQEAKSIKIENKDDFILTISAKKIKTKVAINGGEKSVDKYIGINKNIYLHLKKNIKYEIVSNKEIFISDLFPTSKVDKSGIKLNLFIFIDGLSSQMFNYNNKDKLNYTKEFFKDGLNFRNHYCNQEWSLPSGANIFSGCHFQKHRVFHNNNFSVINENLKLLPEIFDQKKYMTCMINGSHRLNPAYGFSKGFKRILYKQGMSSNEVIDHFFEFENVFRDTNKFLWLTFFDLHEAHNNKSISSNYFKSDGKETKSKINETFNQKYLDEYFKVLNNLDNKLNSIYKYINNNYSKDEVLISLISDHAQTFFDNEINLLKDSRIKIPWLLKGRNVRNLEIDDITENIDILPTIAKLNDFKIDLMNIDGRVPSIFGGEKKEYSFTQSIYPNSTYKSRISFDDVFYSFESEEKIDDNGKLNNLDLKNSSNHQNDIPVSNRYDLARKITEKNLNIFK